MIKINPESKTEFLQELRIPCVRPKFRQSRTIILTADIVSPMDATGLVTDTSSQIGKIDILVNNAGRYRDGADISNVTDPQFGVTMQTIVYGGFYIAKAVAKQMEKNDIIIFTTSMAAFAGSAPVDYSASKGAIVGFIRALAQQLLPRGIRVNVVAPSTIWTPLSVSRGTKDVVHYTERIGDTCELAPTYIFLAAYDSNFMTGQVLHVNGGKLVYGGL